jgi:hypothetical protein
MSKLVAILVLSFGASTAAFAGSAQLCLPWPFQSVCFPIGGSGPTAAPEIDPASAMSGVSLLIGGLAVLRGRRKKQP